mmetsp:Transcript_25174/g.25380  ORF Transcript_25174/g.25380 Transcript_25174/m.25380 type:complete len:754 (-) Transcript_25174:102-2363(-)
MDKTPPASKYDTESAVDNDECPPPSSLVRAHQEEKNNSHVLSLFQDKTDESNGAVINKPNSATVQAQQNAQNEVSLFETKYPKNIIDGTLYGAGDIILGTVSGVALMVTAPYKGAVEGSVNGGTSGAMKGFGYGLCYGIVGGTAMALSGAFNGISQVGLGLINTGGSIAPGGKDWDEEKGEWVAYSLVLEAEEIKNILEEREKRDGPLVSPGSGGRRVGAVRQRVKDNSFYELLGVYSHISTSEVRTAFLDRARETHPESHKYDEGMFTKFERIGEAFQILSDDKLRHRYDIGGREAVMDVPTVDPGALYSMVAALERIETLVGDVSVSSLMQVELEKGAHHGQPAGKPSSSSSSTALVVSNTHSSTLPSTASLKEKAFIQRNRQVKCAIYLASKLQLYCCNSGEEFFKAWGTRLATDLTRSGVLGSALLAVIGICYMESVKLFSGGLQAWSVGLSQAGRLVSNRYHILTSGIQSAKSAKEAVILKNTARVKQEQQLEDLQDETYAKMAACAGIGVCNIPIAIEKRRTEERQMLQEEEKKKIKVSEALSSAMLDLMWHVVIVDIENTLKKVCHKVIRDHAVGVDVRKQRAMALMVLGEECYARGNEALIGMGVGSFDNISDMTVVLKPYCIRRFHSSSSSLVTGRGRSISSVTSSVENESALGRPYTRDRRESIDTYTRERRDVTEIRTTLEGVTGNTGVTATHRQTYTDRLNSLSQGQTSPSHTENQTQNNEIDKDNNLREDGHFFHRKNEI